MKKILFACFLLLQALTGFAQAETTKNLQTKFKDALAFYFYQNTLRMLNQKDNKEFEELFRDIDKMKLLIIDKPLDKFGTPEYKKLKSDYQKEDYESVMTTRYQGRNFDVLFKDSMFSSPGTIILVNDSSNLYVLDVIGKIDVNKVGKLFSSLSESADIGKKIRDNFDKHKE